MSEKNLVYTNLADSVIYAGFRGHQYNLNDSNGKPISETYESRLDGLLEKVKERNDTTLTLTLNQVCDNKYLLLEKQTYHFNLLKELLQSGKLKITVYGGLDLVSYTEQALEQCLQRLCGGEIDPNLVYVSSLFPELGIENTPSPTRKGITLLLGYFPTSIQYNEKEKKFKLSNGEFYSFIDLVNKSKRTSNRDPKYGILTEFYSYNHFRDNFNLDESDFDYLIRQGKLNLKEVKKIITWIQNLFELNRIAHENNAFPKNATTGIRLNDIINRLLDNVSLLDEKLDFWLGKVNGKIEVKQGIRAILKQLSEKHTNRTAMYIDVKAFMENFAQEHQENKTLYKKFHTAVGEEAKKLPYQRVLFTIINIIDYCYNILNMFFAVESYRMIESFFSFKSIEAGVQAVGLTEEVKAEYELETLSRQEV